MGGGGGSGVSKVAHNTCISYNEFFLARDFLPDCGELDNRGPIKTGLTVSPCIKKNCTECSASSCA